MLTLYEHVYICVYRTESTSSQLTSMYMYRYMYVYTHRLICMYMYGETDFHMITFICTAV